MAEDQNNPGFLQKLWRQSEKLASRFAAAKENQEMTSAAATSTTETSATEPLSRGKQSKFTPANVRQIINLVDRGKTREEIAEIIGVTPATLAVTCSRLKISLRRPRFDLGTGLLRQRRRSQAPAEVNSRRPNGIETSGAPEQMEEQLPTASTSGPMKDVTAVVPHTAIFNKTSIPASPKLGVRMQYKDNDQTVELPLNLEMVGRFFLEAEFRNMRIGELLARLILGIAERDLFELVLDSVVEPRIRANDGGAVAEGKQPHPTPRVTPPQSQAFSATPC